jgi:RHS repeat-associated protein
VVSPDTEPPAVDLEVTGNNPLNMGDTETFMVLSSDNVGVVDRTLTVTNNTTGNSTHVGLDGSGQGSLTISTPGLYTATATATDDAGNTGTATQTLHVVDPTNVNPPTVTITSPTDQASVTAPTDIVGTVTDDRPGVTYTVTVIPVGGGTATQIGSGGAVSNGVLAHFDPTLLENGSYDIEVTAVDDGGNATTVDREVEVEGNLKLGDFNITFTDLTVPVAGIPIRITRTYDTLQAKQSLDFGYGWRIGFGDAKLKVNLVDGAEVGWGGYPAFLDGTRVYVTFPDGQRQGFTFMPYETAYDPFGLIRYWHPFFIPDAGNRYLLSTPDELLDKDPDSGEYSSITEGGDLATYNPQNPEFGNQYTLTDRRLTETTVNATTGKLISVSDRNGNKLTYSDDGISSNAGRDVTFTRDGAGRITAITDPRGHALHYTYSAAGDLMSVTDRQSNVPVTFQYGAAQPHYLTAVVDELGNKQVTVAYASDGRLSQVKDPAGTPTNFSFDVNNLTQTTTEPGNNNATRVITYDSRGNITGGQDPGGQVTLATYQNDLPTTVTQVGPDGNHTTTTTYDSAGNPLTVTDPNGNVTRKTFGPGSELMTSSDPQGNTVHNQYDDFGNPLRVTSATGETVQMSYDAHGNMTSVTQGAAVSEMGYNSFGDVTAETSATGVEVNSTYDANGNKTGSTQTWVNPANPAQTQTLTTTAVYDANDLQTDLTDTQGNHTQTKYDSVGRIWRTVDARGGNTDRLFDARNYPVQVTRPDGTATRTVYDAKGRATYVTDAFVPGGANDPPHVTRTLWDTADRSVGTERWANVFVSLTQVSTGTYTTAAVVADGRPFDPDNLAQYNDLPADQRPVRLSATSTVYDTLGRIIQTTDASGLVTQTTYDAADRATAVVQTLPGGHQIATATAYDDVGRVVSTTDGLNHTTRYEYNADGRQTRTTFADNTTYVWAYDSVGHLKSTTDQMGRTTDYEIDALGRLTAEVLPAVVNPATGQSARPRTEYTYDDYGNQLTQRDALGRVTTFAHDAFNNLTSRTLPQGQGDTSPPTESMTYDSFGRMASRTDFGGNVTVYHYDALLGRLTETDFFAAGHNPATSPPDQEVTVQYDPLGRLSQVVDSAYGTVTYGYDSDSHMTSVTTPEGQISYGYDLATGWHTSTTTANTGIQYGYDALGRLTSVHLVKSRGVDLVAAGTDQTQSYTFDDANQLTHTSLTQGSSVVVTADYTYDPLNRLLTGVQRDGANNQLASYTYQRQADGFIHQVDESNRLPSGATRTDTVVYTYDALGRLTEAVLTSSDTTLNRTTDYTFDLVGNRLAETTVAGGQTTVATSTYDPRDRLLTTTTRVNGGPGQTTTYTYDVRGNLTGQTNPDGSTVTYTFDLRGRMVQVVKRDGSGAVQFVETLTYNSNDILTGTTVTEGGVTTTSRFLIDRLSPTGFADVLEHADGAGALVASYLQGHLPISQARAGAMDFYLQDGHSGVRQLVNALGAVVAAYLYDAYGQQLALAGAVPNPLLYRAQWFDPLLGQYYLRARFYDPATGRFTSMDPQAGNPSNPLSLHRYLYTPANPVNFQDPNGRMFGLALGLVGFLVGFGIAYFVRHSKDTKDLTLGAIIKAALYKLVMRLVEFVLMPALFAALGYYLEYSYYLPSLKIVRRTSGEKIITRPTPSTIQSELTATNAGDPIDLFWLHAHGNPDGQSLAGGNNWLMAHQGFIKTMTGDELKALLDALDNLQPGQPAPAEINAGTDLTAAFQAAVAPAGTVKLTGCDTASSDENFVKRASLILPGRTLVGMIDEPSFIAQFEDTGTTRSYVNGAVVP